jgi:hypothetical protein
MSIDTHDLERLEDEGMGDLASKIRTVLPSKIHPLLSQALEALEKDANAYKAKHGYDPIRFSGRRWMLQSMMQRCKLP